MITTTRRLVPGTRSRDPQQLLWLIAFISALFVMIRGFAYKTSRLYGSVDSGGTRATEGASEAIPIFLLGIACIALVFLGRNGRGWSFVLLGVAVAPFFIASYLAAQQWLQLLDERGKMRDYALQIGIGVPIATIAGAIGGVALLGLLVFRHFDPIARR